MCDYEIFLYQIAKNFKFNKMKEYSLYPSELRQLNSYIRLHHLFQLQNNRTILNFMLNLFYIFFKILNINEIFQKYTKCKINQFKM
jgi:hypothetical protein